MSDSGFAAGLRRTAGGLLLIVGVAVFAIRLRHAGPYAFPEGGNLLAALLCLGIGGLLLAVGPGSRLAAVLGWLGLAASPVVLFFALYAVFAELEEVVVLRAVDREGRPADLRLWIVDDAGAEWVTMPRWKADAHGLGESRVQLLREGQLRCVVASRREDRATVNRVHHLRHAKYAVQRFATWIGLFGEDAGEETVALRLTPCPDF